MNIDVALIPAQTDKWLDKVCIVVDVLRASSTLVTLLESGASRVYAIRSLAHAHRLKRTEGCILAGERKGYPPPGFDFGNSPFRLAQADLQGRPVVLSTSNGTAVLNHLKGFPLVLAGCFLNAQACCQAAIEAAQQRELEIGVVCSGHLGKFLLDDAVCAGYLVSELQRQLDARHLPVKKTDSALAAEKLYTSFPDILTAFLLSETGQKVIEIGDAPDNEFCSRIDVSQKVPMLVPGAAPRLVNYY